MGPSVLGSPPSVLFVFLRRWTAAHRQATSTTSTRNTRSTRSTMSAWFCNRMCWVCEANNLISIIPNSLLYQTHMSGLSSRLRPEPGPQFAWRFCQNLFPLGSVCQAVSRSAHINTVQLLLTVNPAGRQRSQQSTLKSRTWTRTGLQTDAISWTPRVTLFCCRSRCCLGRNNSAKARQNRAFSLTWCL